MEKIQEEHPDETVLQQNVATIAKSKTVITEEDIRNIPGLKDIEVTINAAKNELKNAPAARQSQLKRIIQELRADQKILKECHLRPAYFSRLNFTSTEYTFDEHTGYYDNGIYYDISQNKIDLSDPWHILQLLNHYSQLRHQHFDDSNSDMRYILDTLDYLIEKADLKEVFSRVLLHRVDGMSFQDIADDLLTTYNISLSAAYLSSAFAKDIPKQIAKVHANMYEDWYYTMVEKGDYKKCAGDCGQNKLRINKYFSKDKKAKDGLSNVCKVCRNQE